MQEKINKIHKLDIENWNELLNGFIVFLGCDLQVSRKRSFSRQNNLTFLKLRKIDNGK
jgi:hypothetical protein